MSQGCRTRLADGRQIHAIALTNDAGRWLGNVILEYDDAQQWGRYYSITDYSDYGYHWDAIGKGGFEAFLIKSNRDYLMGKLAQGHDEARVCNIDKTVAALKKILYSRWRGDSGVDADYLGDALDGLKRIEDVSGLWVWQSEHDYICNAEDVYEAIVMEPGGYLEGYKQAILPALKRYLQEAANGQVD